MDNTIIPSRKYLPGACFDCQLCLHCGTNNKYKFCCCNKEQKAKPGIKRAYSRVYKSQFTNSSQATLIRTRNDLFGYELNFDNEFSFTLCSTCNSNFQRLSKRGDQKKLSIDSTIMLEDSQAISGDDEYLSSVDKESFNLEVKLLVKSGSITNPAKWIKLPSSNYVKFSDALHQEVISILDNENVKKKHYLVAYKNSAANRAGTQLMDSHDFEKFLDEYKCMKKVSKSLMVTVFLSRKRKKEKTKNKRKKKVGMAIYFELN
jgi:hypothetical protein